MKYLSVLILIMGLFFGSCKTTDFLSTIDKIEADNPHCPSPDTCHYSIALIDSIERPGGFELTYFCVYLLKGTCWPINPCDTLDCDDASLCTDDHCDSLLLCFYRPGCNDGDLCTFDYCAPDEVSCVYDIIPCSDGDNCTNDICLNGVCVPFEIDCDDGDACTTDACMIKDGNCNNRLIENCNCVPLPASNPCKVRWCYSDGTNSGEQPRDCTDDDACTNDFCVPTSATTWQCMHPEVDCNDGGGGPWWCEPIGDYGICMYGACDDRNACTNDWWNEATAHCEVLSLVDCNDGSGNFWCDPQQGCQYGTPKKEETEFSFYATANPFHVTTLIKLVMPQQERVNLTVVDVSGKKVHCESLSTDRYTFRITAPVTGVYFCRLVTESGDVHIRKIVSQ